MKKFNWGLGLLTLGSLMILADIAMQSAKKNVSLAKGIGLTGTALVLIGTGLMFSVKSDVTTIPSGS